MWWTIRAACSAVLPREQPVSQARRRRRISPRLIRVLHYIRFYSPILDNTSGISTCIQRKRGLPGRLLKMHGDLADVFVLLNLHITSFFQILGDK